MPRAETAGKSWSEPCMGDGVGWLGGVASGGGAARWEYRRRSFWMSWMLVPRQVASFHVVQDDAVIVTDTRPCIVHSVPH